MRGGTKYLKKFNFIKSSSFSSKMQNCSYIARTAEGCIALYITRTQPIFITYLRSKILLTLYKHKVVNWRSAKWQICLFRNSRWQICLFQTLIIKSFTYSTFFTLVYYIYNIYTMPLPVTNKMSYLMGKPTMWIGETKGADQLRSNCEPDQLLCFRYMESTIPLLLKSEISSF